MPVKSMKSTSFTFRAYAKINIGLRILARRPDGYHDIETFFHRIDLFDDITFEPAESIIVATDSPDIPADASNICHKAAMLIREHLEITKGVRITITKRIPVGAGLGGGSSDAATVLRKLPDFWDQRIERETASSFALQLGSDVPFFLHNQSAVGRGRGEILDFVPLEIPYHILVCNPGVHISTAWAYQQVRPRARNATTSLVEDLQKAMKNPQLLATRIGNDFEEALFPHVPRVRELKQQMLQGGALLALMSGSGSSVFGFLDSAEKAARLSSELRGKGLRVFHTHPHFHPAGVSPR